MLPTAVSLLCAAALFWVLLIRDVHTAMAWSNSFCLLSPAATTLVYWAALAFAGAGALLATIRAARTQNRRSGAITVAALNLLLPIAGHALASYVGNHTEAAILQQR